MRSPPNRRFVTLRFGVEPMPRQSIGDRPMTDAERQARYRAARAAGTPVIRTRRPADHRSRARRWHDAVAVIVDLQAAYSAWLEALPENLLVHPAGDGDSVGSARRTESHLPQFPQK
jgi:hypothetical protein